MIVSPRVRLADLIARTVRANSLRNSGVCVMPIEAVPSPPSVDTIEHKLMVKYYGRRLHFSARCSCGETFSRGPNDLNWQFSLGSAFSRHLMKVEKAKAAGIPYVPGPERVRKLIDSFYPEIPSPPLQPE